MCGTAGLPRPHATLALGLGRCYVPLVGAAEAPNATDVGAACLRNVRCYHAARRSLFHMHGAHEGATEGAPGALPMPWQGNALRFSVSPSPILVGDSVLPQPLP